MWNDIKNTVEIICGFLLIVEEENIVVRDLADIRMFSKQITTKRSIR